MNNSLICLACIIGNEEAIIERFIRAFAPAADNMVFVQAIGKQEPDGTEKIINKICNELKIQYIFQEYFNKKNWEHIDDFSAARNKAWELACDTEAKYLLWADADDIISFEDTTSIREAATNGTKDVYIIPYEVRGKSQIVYRERMVINDACSKWIYPVHEMLEFNRDVTYAVIKDVAIVHAPLDNKKSSSGRNRAILEESIKQGARNLFYLSQEYAETGNPEIFKIYAKAALNYPGLEVIEKYEILMNLAQNETEKEESRKYAALAYQLMPDRREALALLACYALVDKRYEEAFYLAKHMATLPVPKKSYWTLNQDWYTWKGFYLLTQAMRMVGKENEARELEKDRFEKNGAIFTIIHPTYMRPYQALAVRDIYLSKASNPMSVEYIFGVNQRDEESREILSGYHHTISEIKGCTPNAIKAIEDATGKFIMVIADDLFPPDSWDMEILKRIPNMSECYALNFNDLLRTDGLMCHSFVTASYMEKIMEDRWPGTGIYGDNEFTYRARKAGIVIDAPDLIFEHRHFSNGKAPFDATYNDQNQKLNYEEGLRIFRERNPNAPLLPEEMKQ